MHSRLSVFTYSLTLLIDGAVARHIPTLKEDDDTETKPESAEADDEKAIMKTKDNCIEFSHERFHVLNFMARAFGYDGVFR